MLHFLVEVDEKCVHSRLMILRSDPIPQIRRWGVKTRKKKPTVKPVIHKKCILRLN